MLVDAHICRVKSKLQVTVNIIVNKSEKCSFRLLISQYLPRRRKTNNSKLFNKIFYVAVGKLSQEPVNLARS